MLSDVEIPGAFTEYASGEIYEYKVSEYKRVVVQYGRGEVFGSGETADKVLIAETVFAKPPHDWKAAFAPAGLTSAGVLATDGAEIVHHGRESD